MYFWNTDSGYYEGIMVDTERHFQIFKKYRIARLHEKR